jgi:type IV pilus assembly protein PilW
MNQRLHFRRAPDTPSKHQRGFTLVELMVSMVISLVILAALVTIFVNTSNRNREMERTNGMIESGRLAVQVLENDIVHAGFWGSFVPQFDDQTSVGVPGDAPTGVPDPCLAYDVATWNAAYKTDLIGIPVQSYGDGAGVCAGVITNKVPDTDILVVRHADTCVPGSPSPCEADVPGKLYFQASQCPPISAYVLDKAGFTLQQRDCVTVADKRKFVSDIYYIRNFAVTGGDGIPTLMRSQFGLDPVTGEPGHEGAVPLIEGIEGFSVELGIDDVSKTGEAVDFTQAILWDDPATHTTPKNRGDGSPDGDFVSCSETPGACDAYTLSNVTAVKLWVLSRSREPSIGYTDTKTYTLGGGVTMGPFNDGFKRHVFVTTVRLPNYSGRRMTP